MKLTRRNFHARVVVTDDNRILIGFGLLTFDCPADEARALMNGLGVALERVQYGSAIAHGGTG